MKKQNNKKKVKTNRYYIIALILILLVMGVGYSIFNKSLDIFGTATTSGEYDIQFSATSIKSSVGCIPTSTISGDKNSLNISVPDLAYPGATATISVTVRNTGNIASELISVPVTGNSDTDIVVTFPSFATGTVLAPADTYTFDIVVTWAAASTTTNKNVSFTATLNYEQSV